MILLLFFNRRVFISNDILRTDLDGFLRSNNTYFNKLSGNNLTGNKEKNFFLKDKWKIQEPFLIKTNGFAT